MIQGVWWRLKWFIRNVDYQPNHTKIWNIMVSEETKGVPTRPYHSDQGESLMVQLWQYRNLPRPPPEVEAKVLGMVAMLGCEKWSLVGREVWHCTHCETSHTRDAGCCTVEDCHKSSSLHAHSHSDRTDCSCFHVLNIQIFLICKILQQSSCHFLFLKWWWSHQCSMLLKVSLWNILHHRKKQIRKLSLYFCICCKTQH